MKPERWSCLFFPGLSSQRLERDTPPLRNLPFVVVELDRQRMIVAEASRRAQEEGIGAGMLLAAAHAVVPDLLVEWSNREADARTLAGLGRWALCLAPLVAPYGEDPNHPQRAPQALVLESGGSAHLFGGEAPMLEHAVRGLARLGFSARAAVADSPRAAFSLARGALDQPAIAPPGEGERALAGLDLSVLQLDRSTLESLGALGLHRLGDVLALPREGLAARFSPLLDRRVRELLGETRQAPQPYRQRSCFAERIELETPVEGGQPLLFLAKRLVDQLSARLEGSGAGLLELVLRLEHEKHPATLVRVRSLRAQQSPKALILLLTTKLDVVEFQHPVSALELEAGEWGALEARQGNLFEGRAQRQHDELPDLLARLAARLGKDALQRAELCEDYRPEHSWKAAPYLEEGGESTPKRGAHPPSKRTKPRQRKPKRSKGAAKAESPWEELFHQSPSGAPALGLPLRPAWLLQPPRPIVVESAAGIPQSYEGQPLLRVEGPERIRSGWWERREVWRDYFRVQLGDGEWLWIYHDLLSKTFYLHGRFV